MYPSVQRTPSTYSEVVSMPSPSSTWIEPSGPTASTIEPIRSARAGSRTSRRSARRSPPARRSCRDWRLSSASDRLQRPARCRAGSGPGSRPPRRRSRPARRSPGSARRPWRRHRRRARTPASEVAHQHRAHILEVSPTPVMRRAMIGRAVQNLGRPLSDQRRHHHRARLTARASRAAAGPSWSCLGSSAERPAGACRMKGSATNTSLERFATRAV